MSVTRTEDSPCLMTIHFTPTSPLPTTPTTTTQKTLPLLLRSRSEILTEVLALTQGQKIEPTPAEARELYEMNEEYIQINEIRKKNEIVWEELQREKAILKKAMGEMGGEESKRGRRRAE